MTATLLEATDTRSYRWVIEGSLLLLNFSMGLSFLAVAPLFPLIIDAYGINRATASLLVGGTTLGLAIMIVPCSIFAARLGTRWALTLGGMLLGSMALAPLAGSFGLLLAARVAFAVGAAITLSTVPSVVMRWFPVRELPLVNGANVVAQSVGIALSMVIAPRLAASLEWDVALFVFACVALSATGLWVLVARDPEDAEGTPRTTFEMSDLTATFRSRAAWLLGMGMAGAFAANVSYGSWLPTYYNEELGFSLERAGTLGGLLALFGIGGSLLGSTMPVRFPRRRPFLIVAGLLIPLFAVGTFVSSSPVLLYPSLALFGVAAWIAIPIIFTVPMELPGMTAQRVGVTTALALSLGNIAGFLAPLGVGLLRDATGSFVTGLGVAAALGLILAVAGWLAPETGTRTDEPRASA